jgi:glycosyltransferase involved in cell wall biosynthesis
VNTSRPRVSIGFPVFNGERFLSEAISALLAQNYSDFELIISDNASTDGTQEICEDYATKDRRIRYNRNKENLGAGPNYRLVFELSSGEYFKWAAHDDLHAPEFLQRCVEMLDEDASIVLCFTKTKVIDENGTVIGVYDIEVDATSSMPDERFYNMLSTDHWCFQQFGVIRSNILAKARIAGKYYGWDRTLLAELSLFGRIFEIPEYLFFRRNHSNSSSGLFFAGRKESFMIYDPAIIYRYRFLSLRRFWEYSAAISRSPLSRIERLSCYRQLMRLAVEKSIKRFH